MRQLSETSSCSAEALVPVNQFLSPSPQSLATIITLLFLTVDFKRSFWNVRDVSIKEIVLYLIFTVKHLILPGMAELGFARVNYQVIPPCLIKMGYSLIQLAANSWREPMGFSR